MPLSSILIFSYYSLGENGWCWLILESLLEVSILRSVSFRTWVSALMLKIMWFSKIYQDVWKYRNLEHLSCTRPHTWLWFVGLPWDYPKHSHIKTILSWAVVAYSFILSTWEEEAPRFLSSRPARSKELVPGHLGFPRETNPVSKATKNF